MLSSISTVCSEESSVVISTLTNVFLNNFQMVLTLSMSLSSCRFQNTACLVRLVLPHECARREQAGLLPDPGSSTHGNPERDQESVLPGLHLLSCSFYCFSADPIATASDRLFVFVVPLDGQEVSP